MTKLIALKKVVMVKAIAETAYFEKQLIQIKLTSGKTLREA